MSQPVHILFATMTGNAEHCAGAVEKALRSLGCITQVQNVADIKPAELKRDPLLLFCVSTYGEGDPPPDAEDFFDGVKRLAPPTLRGARYAVLALGDTSYEEFCGFGRKLDVELQRLGARPILDRVETDVDYEDALGTWVNDVCAVVRRETAPATA
jgi:sulfite reductase (NADPH) flavoprotein alpha-component